MPEFVSLNVHDLLFHNGRVWKVCGVYHGGRGHEDLVEIEPLDRKMSEPRLPIQVPIALIGRDMVYRHVNHDEIASGRQ